MKVLVAIKRVIDPYVKVRVRSDGQGVETNQVKMAMNPFDEIALEEAIRWKEAKLVTEIIVVSIGPSSTAETLRAGLALGADSAIHVLYDQKLEPLGVAKCLQKLVQEQSPDIVILGKQAIDDDCNQTGQMLAGLLQWPQASFASKIVFNPDKKSALITREVDGGLETLEAVLPVVITTDLRLNEPRYASLPNIMQAKRKPLTTIALDTLGVDVKPRLSVLKVTPPAARKPGRKVASVEELVHCLRDIEKVLK